MLLFGSADIERFDFHGLSHRAAANALGTDTHRLVLAAWQGDMNTLQIGNELAARNAGDLGTYTA